MMDYQKMSREELREELCRKQRDAERIKLISDASKAERERADRSYAPIIVKTIVFTAIGAICIAFITWLTKLVWPR